MATLYYRDPADGLLKPFVVGSPSQLAGRNRIINGDFSVNQRALSSGSIVGVYQFIHDRWIGNGAGGTATYSAQAAGLGDLPESARSFARLVTSGQAATSNYAMVTQRIEDVRTLSGKQVVVSFWARSPTSARVGVDFWQQAGGTGGGAVNGGYVTTTPTWARYSVTVDIPKVPVAWTLTNASFLAVELWSSCGSDYAARTGGMGLQNATVDLWGVQVEEGPVATQFDQRAYADELRACQRYYLRRTSEQNAGIFSAGYQQSTTMSLFYIPFTVPMRIPPPTFGSSAPSSLAGAGQGTAISMGGTTVSTHGARVDIAHAAVGTAGAGTVMQAFGNAAAYIEFSAEL